MLRIAFLSALIFINLTTPCLSDSFQSTGTIDAYFSPNGGATEAIVDELDAAKQHIMVQAYSFTSKPIAKALNQAHKRGVKVEVILDNCTNLWWG